jgi:hypothetical protein
VAPEVAVGAQVGGHLLRGSAHAPAGVPTRLAHVERARQRPDRERLVGEPGWDAGRCVSGPPEKVAAYLRTYRDLGCHQVQVGFASRSADELCDQIAAFAAEVAPLVNA